MSAAIIRTKQISTMDASLKFIVAIGIEMDVYDEQERLYLFNDEANGASRAHDTCWQVMFSKS